MLYARPMETIISVIGNVARVVALLGGVLSAVFIAYAGIQWMTATGDPQRMSQARMSLIGAVIGLVIVGVAFLVPGVISEMVIEPSGGIAVEVEYSTDCDAILKRQLVTYRTASRYNHMNYLIARIQADRDECGSGLWDPEIGESRGLGITPGSCFVGSASTAEGELAVDGVVVPSALWTTPQIKTGRDSENNILVHFNIGNLPSDSAVCWLYSSSLDVWVSGGRSI